jgi:Type VI secretion system/phage-baseplate injector OB domain
VNFFGKYRGKVENNIDPLFRGRLQVSCPTVLGRGKLTWAEPCVPYAGNGVGLFAIPPRGADVWIEFEGGRPERGAIWVGGFWGIGEAPAQPAVPEMKVLKTGSVTLTMSDLPGIGGFMLEVKPPAVTAPLKIVCNSTGIELSIGKSSVMLTPASVSVNKGALEVI